MSKTYDEMREALRRAVESAVAGMSDQDDLDSVLADVLDSEGMWDWSDGSDYSPSDRLAVVECDGTWYTVYRGTEGDESTAYGSEVEARAALAVEIAELEESAALTAEEGD